jgi:hypothetical protein
MRSLRTIAFFALCVLVLGARPAHAQTEGWLALGGGYTHTSPADSDSTTPHDAVGFAWRFGHPRTGFKWAFGFNWFTTDVLIPIGGDRTTFGRMHVRPFMPGYGYTVVLGRAAITGDVIGGYAFDSFKMRATGNDAYRLRLGAEAVSTDVSNAWVVKPEINLWYDVNKVLGINVNWGYLVARPTLKITSTLGTDTRHINADQYMFKMGVVYKVF